MWVHVRKSDDDLKEQYWNKEERKNGLRNIQTGNDRGSEAEITVIQWLCRREWMQSYL